MASRAGSQPTRLSPRKFSEKIALLNKKEREANAKFEEIIKEVHATKGQPNQREPLAPDDSNLASCPDNDLSSLTNAELQFQLANSTNYKAAHADSLEEIEKVYENLIRSVGGCEDSENRNENGQIVGACQLQQQQQQSQSANNRSTILHYNNGEASKSTFRSSSAGAMRQPDLDNTAPTFYHQETTNIDYPTSNDLKAHQQGQQPTYNPYEPPLSSSSSFINTFSGHNTLDVCVSTSCIPQQQQQQQIIHHQPLQHIDYPGNITTQQPGRTRVVSFGSASRNKFSCINACPFNYPVDVGQQQQQQLNHVHQKATYQSANAQNRHQHPSQYLKEPSGDRSRQKSCSDPELHILPGGQQLAEIPAGPFKSDNRLTVTVGRQVIPINTTTSLVTVSGQDCRLLDQRSQQTTNNDINIYDNINQSGKVDYSTGLIQNDEDPNRTIPTIKSDFCLEPFGVCDTTTDGISRVQLPGIKICAIDDEINHSTGMLPAPDQISDNMTSNPSSRDGSLPDISNLKFSSPEKCQVYQGQQWPVHDENSQVVMDGNWSTCAVENVDMDIQIDTSQDAIDYDQIQQQFTNTEQTQTLQDGGTFVEPINRVNNGLSNSDCNFNASTFHHQHGKLMICASSELYNNIMRSRSHNNISSMNTRKGINNNYLTDSLQQFERRHHTSQYCLQTGHQPQVNVRRISELKSHGTSTSPLDSSSNLNSPQSEMNSPGSSTTEQCEPALMFASNNQHPQQQQQQQREYYHHTGVNIAGGSSSTLVPDGMHFHPQHYKQTGGLAGSSETSHHLQQQVPLTATGTMFVDQLDCSQPELAAAYQNPVTDCSPQAHIDCRPQLTGVSQQDVYQRKFTSPSSTTNFISNDDSAMMNNNTE